MPLAVNTTGIETEAPGASRACRGGKLGDRGPGIAGRGRNLERIGRRADVRNGQHRAGIRRGACAKTQRDRRGRRGCIQRGERVHEAAARLLHQRCASGRRIGRVRGIDEEGTVLIGGESGTSRFGVAQPAPDANGAEKLVPCVTI